MNLKIGKVIADIYCEIWNKFIEVTGSVPVSSQKRFILLLESSKRLNTMPKELLNEIKPLLGELRRQQHKIIKNQDIIEEIVLKIYGIRKEDWI